MISVIIPTYNRAYLLIEAVNSCLNQGVLNLEIIIVDDGSTDNTESIVKKIMRSTWLNKNIVYCKQNNKGASSARNTGLKLAKGNYIQFLDSDDILLPGKFNKQIEALSSLENKEAALCYCYGVIGDVYDESKLASMTLLGIKEKEPLNLIRRISSRVVHGMPTLSPLWRRTHLLQHEGWREDIGLGDDLEYHVRLLSNTKKICFVEEPLFFVREHMGQRLSVGIVNEKALISHLKAKQSVYEVLVGLGVWDVEMQSEFLSTIRTIYANSLQLGKLEVTLEVERWLYLLSILPKRYISYQILIYTRRFFGGRFLFTCYSILNKIKVIQ